jgi:hypothetical protein
MKYDDYLKFTLERIKWAIKNEQDTERRQNKTKYTMQKTKKMSKPDHTKNPGVNPTKIEHLNFTT